VNVKPAEAQVQPLAKPEEMDPPAAMRAIPTQPEPAAKFAPVEPERTLTATPAKELTQPASRLEAAQLLMRKEPVYPPLAVQSHVSGAVEVRFHIRVDGTVHDVTVIKGNPVLARAAIDAVEAWRYNPARLSGFPIETDGNAVLNFAK